MDGKERMPGGERVLTGDRTTGRLHVGHLVGSLQNRVALQDRHELFLLLADVQALTTNFSHPEGLRESVRGIVLDYLAVGIDPRHATIVVQSLVPEIAELTVYYSMFVTVNSLRHNPTIKAEAAERGYKDLYYGFLGYPVSQAADITFCKATLVPVGEDQLPHIEQTRRIVRRFNELYGAVFPEPRPLVGRVPRLAGLDGHGKMSKSRNNAIYLDSTQEEVTAKLRAAVTDPARVHATDSGHPEICPVFAYQQAFNEDGAAEVHAACSAGRIGCKACKEMVAGRLEAVLQPIRERRQRFAARPDDISEILLTGTERARGIARETMAEVREAMKMNYLAESGQ